MKHSADNDYARNVSEELHELLIQAVKDTADLNPKHAATAQEFALKVWIGSLVGVLVYAAAMHEGTKPNDSALGDAGRDLSLVLSKHFPSLPSPHVVLDHKSKRN